MGGPFTLTLTATFSLRVSYRDAKEFSIRFSMQKALEIKYVSGYDKQLLIALEDFDRFASVSLYFRGFTVKVEFDKEKGILLKSLSEKGEAGLILKSANDRKFLIMEIGGENSLHWEVREDHRFNVGKFHVGKVLVGERLTCQLVKEWLNNNSSRLYSEISAVKPRDFAIDLFDHLINRSESAKLIDQTNFLIDDVLAREGRNFPSM